MLTDPNFVTGNKKKYGLINKLERYVTVRRTGASSE
jgi:hypothetical protein